MQATLVATCLALAPRAPPPRMGAPTAELLQFLPMMPPIDPGAQARPALKLAGSALSDPVWFPQLNTLALIDRGRQLCWPLDSPEPPRELGALDARCHVALGSSAETQSSGLATVDSAGRLQLVLGADPAAAAAAVPVPLAGYDETGPCRLILPLSEARLLTLADAGDLVLLSADPERTPQMERFVPRRPVTLLTGVQGATGLCVSEDERSLYILTPTALYHSSIDLDVGSATVPQPLPLLASEGGRRCSAASAVGTDESGNLYVCTAEGLVVGDAEGQPLLSVPMPEPASGVCFGGASRSQLFVSSGSTLWEFKTNVMGVKQPSSDFLWQMESLAAQGTFRHAGW